MQGEEFKEHQAFKLMKWFHLLKSFCHVARGWNCSYLINLQHQSLYISQNSLFFVLWLEKFIIAGSITDKSYHSQTDSLITLKHLDNIEILNDEFQKYYLEMCEHLAHVMRGGVSSPSSIIVPLCKQGE